MNEQEIEELRYAWSEHDTTLSDIQFQALCDLALSALRPAEPVAEVIQSTGTITVILALEPNIPVGTKLFAAPPAESAEVWIAVSERLPEANRWVLVHNGKWTGVGVYRPAPTYANEPEEYWQDEHCEFIELLGPKVTHWQPLPTPPLAARSAW